MKFKTLPDPKLLRDLIKYEPETGHLIWKPRKPAMFNCKTRSAVSVAAGWNSRCAGTRITAMSNSGYVKVSIMGEKYLAHRIVWAIQTGEADGFEIDHINGDRTDNRWLNLRKATHAENMRNKAVRSDSSTGVTGVHYSKRDNLYSAEIHSDGRKHRLGSFKGLDDAVAARKAAERKLGFHPNHGRSA